MPEKDYSSGRLGLWKRFCIRTGKREARKQMKKRRSFRQVLCDALRLFLNDIKSAKWAIVVIIAYFVFFRKMLYSLCPAVVLTGFPCPGCGLTRAGAALLCLDFYGAWKIHPFIYPIVLLLLLFCLHRYILMRKNALFFKWCGVCLLLSMIIFYVWRMYRYFPGDPPMSYYRYNVLQRVVHFFR